jgi:hypothetical protein
MATISDDDGDINIAIPDYDKAAFDELLRGIKTAGLASQDHETRGQYMCT